MMLIGLQLSGADQHTIERYCSEALARAEEIGRSSDPDAAADLPAHLARLCAMLTEHGPADGLPRQWSSVINDANRTDGAPQHLHIAAALPPIDGVAIRIDSFVSEPRSWRLYLSAEPGWWSYAADGGHKSALMSVHAEDDLGGFYLSQFGGSTGHQDDEDLTLRFMPRLNPLARALTLTFAGRTEQGILELHLPRS
jgi:hypothetical protein